MLWEKKRSLACAVHINLKVCAMCAHPTPKTILTFQSAQRLSHLISNFESIVWTFRIEVEDGNIRGPNEDFFFLMGHTTFFWILFGWLVLKQLIYFVHMRVQFHHNTCLFDAPLLITSLLTYHSNMDVKFKQGTTWGTISVPQKLWSATWYREVELLDIDQEHLEMFRRSKWRLSFFLWITHRPLELGSMVKT